MNLRTFLHISACALIAVSAGCTSAKSSNTARTGKEQLLISNAVDQSLDTVDFRPFAHRKVFVDEKYIDCVDKNYVVGSIRHRVLRQGGTLVSKREDADVVIETRSGAVGTDTSESFVGIPEITLPGMLTLPEIRLLTKSSQQGTAKIGLVAYDAKTSQVLGDGGLSVARSDDNNWYVFGVGPYQNGSVRQELQRASYSRVGQPHMQLPTQVAFSATPTADEPDRIRLTGGDADSQQPQ